MVIGGMGLTTKHVFACGLLLGMTAACSGPIATRIGSEGNLAATGPTRFVLVNAPGTASDIEQTAQQMIVTRLTERGWRQNAEDAQYSLSVSLSERPATIGITAKATSGDERKVISAPKQTKPLQSCDDVEQRLNVAIVRLVDGARVFRGDAAEYHCKAGLDETLPYLVDAALSGLDNPGRRRVLQRTGRD